MIEALFALALLGFKSLGLFDEDSKLIIGSEVLISKYSKFGGVPLLLNCIRCLLEIEATLSELEVPCEAGRQAD
ncbi:hypothetical protein HCA58_21505 [Micromonospora sp. HNM0581]|uniref:hypothetical protein n=1 Tax=Micromonospora sp. HNM0581 TaxID=2716341 RepID=UPI00146C865F|nr:hypothetical protein [Micromonospora sp. HNM0581]NLU80887.1 hypothetical protein [Micromonospora sp. HNM0581]